MYTVANSNASYDQSLYWCLVWSNTTNNAWVFIDPFIPLSIKKVHYMLQICCSQTIVQLSIDGCSGGCVFVCVSVCSKSRVTQHLHGLSFSLHLSGVRRGSMEAFLLPNSCECLRCPLVQHICMAEWRNGVLFLSARVHKRLFQRHPRIRPCWTLMP